MTRDTSEKENPTDEVADTQKRLCSWAMAWAIIFALCFVVLGQKAIAKGLILGTLFSIINFVALGKTIPITLGRSVAKARFYGLLSIFGRFAVLAVPLIWALKSDSFSFAAVIVGIFSVQLVAIVDYTIIRNFFSRE